MLTRILTLITTLFASLILFFPQNGALQTMLWGPKLFASALSPLLAVLGSLWGVLNLRHKDWLTAGVALIGVVIATKHVREVTTSHEAGLANIFGRDWKSNIPDLIRPRLRPYRWRPYYRRRPQGAVHLDVIYGENSDSGRPLVADLLQPPPGIPSTGLAMIFAHGGGWWYGRKNIGKFPYFQRLVFQGHVVMDINYTLAPHSSVPGMVKDVKQAILWLKQHAGMCGVNPDKVVLTGQSAGAQLCLLAAYAPHQPAFQPPAIDGDTSVSGVISYCGPPDMVALYDDIQNRLIRYLPDRPVNRAHRLIELLGGHGDSLANGIASVVGGTPDEIPELYRLISPITYVRSECPPTLLLQSTHDVLVDYREVERFYHKLHAAKAPVMYVPFPNCAHTFESILPRISPPAQTAAYYMERFLALLV